MCARVCACACVYPCGVWGVLDSKPVSLHNQMSDAHPETSESGHKRQRTDPEATDRTNTRHRQFAHSRLWYRMARYLPSEEDLTKSLPERMRQRAPLASYIVHDLVRPLIHEMDPSIATGQWPIPKANVLHDLLVHVLRAGDPRLVTPVWSALRVRLVHEIEQESPRCISDHLMCTPEDTIKLIHFVALEVRRPRLLLWILCSDKVAEYAKDGSSHDWNGQRFVGEITAIAAAIQECVFVGNIDGLSHEQAMTRFKERYPDGAQERNWNTDHTLNLKGWQMAIDVMLSLCPERLPRMLGDRLIEKKTTKTQASVHQVTYLPCLGVEFADFDTSWLDTLLRHARYLDRDVLHTTISEALKYVRGPNLARIIGQLYEALLEKWVASEEMRARGVVCNTDELGWVWLTLAERAAGYELVETGSGGNCPVPVATERAHQLKTAPSPDDMLMRHPEEFQAIFESLISCHDPNHDDCHFSEAFGNVKSQWDTTSPLFCSVASMAIGKLLGNDKYTKLLGFLLKATEKSLLLGPCPKDADEATQRIYTRRIGWSWLEWPRFFTQICLHHVSLLPMALEHACIVTKHPDSSTEWTPKPEYVVNLKNALWCSMVNEKRQATRLLVQVLHGTNLTSTVAQESHGLDGEADIGFLAFYVLRMGAGASEDDRAKNDEEYGAFVNQRVERDFVRVLRAADWSEEQMHEALRFASAYNRPICASVLMSAPYLLVPGEDAFLQNINAWLYAPGNAGAAKARAEFAERAAAAEAEMANVMSH